ncbi:MAG: isoaspartyl peptidase/L-asparaginase [Bacteroidetes Order II. Incertae sedis bacterium]|nr:isoaspartyl peptidase/L-asparaginase [Bacteroidetes Order II. bacterium]
MYQQLSIPFGVVKANEMNVPMILVHGGAWDIPFGETRMHEEGMRMALDRGRRLLLQNKKCTSVVREVITLLERHPAFDAGIGAVFNRDGEVELDAGIMCGETAAYGAVAGVKTIQHPIQVAFRLMEEGRGQNRFLVAEGAERFAAANGFHPVKPDYFHTVREQRRYEQLLLDTSFHTSTAFSGNAMPRGTVGCVVRDAFGNLAAGTSTGGAPFTLAGRVGDSPIPGAGFFADELVACSATGWGEGILGVQLSSRIAFQVSAQQPLAEAAVQALRHLFQKHQKGQKIEATAGIIILDRYGNGAWAYSTPRMARGGWQKQGAIWTAI